MKVGMMVLKKKNCNSGLNGDEQVCSVDVVGLGLWIFLDRTKLFVFLLYLAWGWQQQKIN